MVTTPCIDHGCKGYGLGYATAWVTVDGKRFTTTKHRKVFYDNTGELPEVVEHLCNNARCINPEHLKAGTHQSNAAYKAASGRARTPAIAGEYSACCKLSDADCEYIRSVYVKGSREFGLPALARKFKVGTSQLHRIVKGARTASYRRIVNV